MSTLDLPSGILNSKWSLYYHLPQERSWALSSYKLVMDDIDSMDKVIALSDKLTDSIVRYCMLFVMREDIAPTWEHPKNRAGGAFLFKVLNKNVPEAWRELMFALHGETLMLDPKNSAYVNGITISPKKNVCIFKIWMSGCNVQDPTSIRVIEALFKQGCSFKKHEPEY
jgi:Eukaryotic initiation factor 4E